MRSNHRARFRNRWKFFECVFRWGGLLFERKKGIPIGNLTSQLFANVYMDAFDHYIKDELRLKHYLRYTDDAVVLHQDRAFLSLLIPFIEQWLWVERRLILHPRKTGIRKLSQGIDFLGYVTLSHHCVLRTRTKRRMFKQVSQKNITSYTGLLEHCAGYSLKQEAVRRIAQSHSLC